MRVLIKNGRVIDPKSGFDAVTNIYIDNGVIEEIGDCADYDDTDIEQLDAAGLTVAPGLVDMHCHLREPGQEYKEDIASGTESAVMGGFTSVACMPNTVPAADNKIVIEYIINKARECAYTNVYPIGAISKGLKGRELAEIGEMKFAGAVAVSDDGRPVEDANLMKNAMLYADTFDIPVISHCEDLSLKNDGVINEGFISTETGLRGITRASEELMVSRECILSQTFGVPVHIAHVSTRNSIDIIRRAKANGARVTCETCPHYFSLTEEACRGYDTNAKMNPPLRTADDVAAVKEGLADGTIDAIATDHAPHAHDEKNCEFDLALNGIVGFETAFSLGITHLVKTGVLTINQLVEKMSAAPSDILGINKGTLHEGGCADIVIFDENEEYTVNVSEFHSKSKNSPFDGLKLCGRVKSVFVGGELVVDRGVLMK